MEDSGKGLYLYNCDPSRSTIDDECCEGQEEHEQQESQLAQIALHLGQDAARHRFEKKAAGRAVKKSAEKAAAIWARSAAGGLARVAMRAHLLVSLTAVVINVAAALAQYAYGSMYRGTRGYQLLVALQYIGTQSAKLANAGGYAMELANAVALSDTEGADMETEGLRNETFDALYKFRVALHDAVSTLQGYSQQYSAIDRRVNVSRDFELSLTLQVADGLISQNDRSAFSLSLLGSALLEVTDWYVSVIDRIYDEREGIMKDDMRAWLALKR